MIATIPEVSVIIAAHNEERFIGRCLRSLLDQNLDRGSYEIIIIDDASTDKTSYAIELFGEAVIGLKNPENLGLPASLNRGIEISSGKYIIRVDADDYVNSNFLGTLKLFLDQNLEMDAVACDYLLVDDIENVLGRASCTLDPIGCAIMFKKEHLIEIGMYDESFKRHEDKELRFRFEKKFTIFPIKLPLYRYRKHESNITNNHELMDEYMIRLNKKHNPSNK